MKKSDWRDLLYLLGRIIGGVITVSILLLFIYMQYINNRDGCHGSLPCESEQTWGQ